MIVGSTSQVRQAEQRENTFTMTSPSLAVTNPDGTAYGSSPTARIGIVDGDYTDQYLYANITPAQGGVYKLAWTYVDDDGETIVRIGEAFATWTDAPEFIRRRFRETRADYPDIDIEPELASAARLILARWPAIGTNDPSASVGVYNGITGDDRHWFDEAIALMVAARMIGPRTTGGAVSDITQKHEGDTQYRFAETGRDRNEKDASPGDPGSGPGGYSGQNERVRWMREAAQAIGRIQCVKQSLQSSAASHTTFRISGPTRTSKAAGNTATLMSGIIRTLTDTWMPDQDQ